MLNIFASLYQYFCMDSVIHTTLNPKGPGCVRIHLLPPKHVFSKSNSLVIINGQDAIPLSRMWSVLLSFFIKEINKWNGAPISDTTWQDIVKKASFKAHLIYLKVPTKKLEEDLKIILNTFIDIAMGKKPSQEIEYISINDYKDQMRAPHRMDLMISPMIRDDKWFCNQKCIHCYAAGQPLAEKKVLSKLEWYAVIDKLWKAGVSQITFTGGEATLNDDLLDLVEHSARFVTRLNTNGVLLTPSLCGNLYYRSLDSVQVTLYSSDEDIHNLLVGAKNFDKTVLGIKTALANKLNVSINTPLCKINSDYVSTLKFLKSIGITYVTCSSLIIAGNAATSKKSKETQLSKEELIKILKEAYEYCKENEMEIAFTSPGWLSDEELFDIGLSAPSCGACLSNMAIAPDGSVIPCQSWLMGGSSLGNILEVPWKEIWEGERCKEIREQTSRIQSCCPLKIQNESSSC